MIFIFVQSRSGKEHYWVEINQRESWYFFIANNLFQSSSLPLLEPKSNVVIGKPFFIFMQSRSGRKHFRVEINQGELS